MRDEIERLLDDLTLQMLAFAIALGWALYQLAHGVATFVDTLFIHLPVQDANSLTYTGASGGLSWVVGRRIITLDGMLVGLLELLFVLVVAAFVRSRLEDRA